jgi:hypothetical protein
MAMPKAEHPGGCPAAPLAAALDDARPLRQPAHDGADQRHGHVGRVLGQHVRRVGHGDAARGGGRHVDLVDAVAEIGDQPELRPGLGDQRLVDAVGHRGHEHVGLLHGGDQLGLGHGMVVDVEARVEQLAHARLDRVRQLARDDDEGFLPARHVSSTQMLFF